MSNNYPKEKFNQKLLVEGKNDQHVVFAFCDKYNVPHNFDVQDTGSVEKLIESIPAFLRESAIQSIGIVVDADENFASRWQQIRDKFAKEGVILPMQLPQNGLIHLEDEKKIGVWIMPNNQLSGMLEDFMKTLIPDNDKLLDKAEKVLNEIEVDKLNKYNKIHHSKALIHTWLSWQENPGTPLGQAISKKYLENEEGSKIFISWLNDLFNSKGIN